MKKISGFKLGLGVAAAAFFAFIPNNTFATIKLGNTEIKANTPVSGITFDGVSAITIENSNTSKTLDIDEGEPITITLKGTNKIGKITSKNKVTFAKSTGSLTLKNGMSISGNGIIVLDSAICADAKLTSNNKSFSATSTGVTISSANCGKGGTEENPDTFDMVYVYAAVLLASSAILGYRRYLAKH